DLLQPVIGLAEETGARLDVLVTGVALPALAYEGVPSGWIAFVESMQSRVDAKRADVVTRLQQAGVSATVSAAYSDVSRFGPVIERHALCADRVVMPDRGLLDDAVGKMVFHSALFHCRRPVLLLGERFRAAPDTVVIGWKNDPHAATAIHHAVPELRKARSVVLTTVDPSGDRDGPNPGRNMAAYLAHHGVAVTVDNRPSAGADVASTLLSAVADHDADRLLVGAFGRSRLRDWVLGTSTQRLIDGCAVSLMVAH
ncbi:MAG: universal stress protein, partial [Pseudomonadota bacterium]